LKRNLVIIFGIITLFYVLIVNAWMSDDAYITLRTVDNFVNGFGITWNISERVQVYTHPLWMLMLSFFYFFTRDAFLMPIVLSLVISVITVYVLIKYIASDFYSQVIIVILVLLSKSYIDYSSSGLENPLTHLIVIFFYYVFFKIESEKKILYLSLLTSLAMLNRYDLVLLCLPVLIYEVIYKRKKWLFQLLYGFIPIIGWSAFSLIYYGFLFPNTAYAKLSAGIPQSDYYVKGFQYFDNILQNDPLTLIIICLAFLISIYQVIRCKELKFIPIALSLLLYNIYILYIGGDFMSGRFFSPLFSLSIVIIAIQQFETDNKKKILLKLIPYLLVFFIGLIQAKAPIYSTIDYGNREGLTVKSGEIPFSDKNQITDERAFYYQFNGLLPVISKGLTEPENEWAILGKQSKMNRPLVINAHSVGIFSYYAGPDNYIVDELALTDAFLSKLPQKYKPAWRIGHIQRVIPEGYLQSLIANKNLISDKNLNEYYSNIKSIISGDIFDFERFKDIIKMNLGHYNHLLTNDYTESDYPVLTSGDSTTLSYYYNDISLYHFYSKNNVKDALYYAFKSIGYKPDFDYIYYNTGIYYWKGLNLPQKALVFMKKAISLNNRFSEAYKALSEIYTELGNTDSSEFYLNILSKLDAN
jgi:arabinofuranosyltransferase